MRCLKWKRSLRNLIATIRLINPITRNFSNAVNPQRYQGLGSATDLMSFRIIDPPTVPDRPVGPDRSKLFSLVFLGLIVAGIGIAFVISQIRPTFHSQMSLREITGKPILGSIPMIWTDQEKTKRKKRLYAFGLSCYLCWACMGY